MSSFFVELWESIFTPGPTRSLLVATNITFASLQSVLLLLLIFFYSIHFVILSLLCGGLWWAINWFARELQEGQRRQKAEASKARDATPAHDTSDTEVETGIVPVPRAHQGQESSAGGRAGGVQVADVAGMGGELKHRLQTAATGTLSSASTEDEWEKVSENEK